MPSTSLRAALFLLLAASIASCRTAGAPTAEEQAINAREQGTNGILVAPAKVYDDALLQQMLTAAQNRLGNLEVIDQAGIAAKIGALTGAAQSNSSFAVSALGPPAAQVATTRLGATRQTVDTVKSSGENSTVSTSGAPAQNVVTTAPQVVAAAPAAPLRRRRCRPASLRPHRTFSTSSSS